MKVQCVTMLDLIWTSLYVRWWHKEENTNETYGRKGWLLSETFDNQKHLTIRDIWQSETF